MGNRKNAGGDKKKAEGRERKSTEIENLTRLVTMPLMIFIVHIIIAKRHKNKAHTANDASS